MCVTTSRRIGLSSADPSLALQWLNKAPIVWSVCSRPDQACAPLRTDPILLAALTTTHLPAATGTSPTSTTPSSHSHRPSPRATLRLCVYRLHAPSGRTASISLLSRSPSPLLAHRTKTRLDRPCGSARRRRRVAGPSCPTVAKPSQSSSPSRTRPRRRSSLTPRHGYVQPCPSRSLASL
jgi:hypothetical protein